MGMGGGGGEEGDGLKLVPEILQHVWRNVEMLLSGYLKIMQVVLTCLYSFVPLNFRGINHLIARGRPAILCVGLIL